MEFKLGIRRFRYRLMTGSELNADLTSIGMSEHEFCKLTGVRDRTLARWLEEGGAPHWVRTWLAMASDVDASDAAHAVTRENLLGEDEYRQTPQYRPAGSPAEI